MAIQPQFSQAILAGHKRIEFRKRSLASDIDTVLIYESAPTQRIVGQFTICRTEQASPRQLWRDYGSVGGIRRADFMQYYRGHAGGVGFLVGTVERYVNPVRLEDLPTRPSVPQSFAYLPSTVVADIQRLQDNQADTWSARALDPVCRPPRSMAAVAGR